MYLRLVIGVLEVLFVKKQLNFRRLIDNNFLIFPETRFSCEVSPVKFHFLGKIRKYYKMSSAEFFTQCNER